VGVVFGLGLICVTLPMGSTLAYTYIMDSYSEMAGEGMVSAILIRNMMGEYNLILCASSKNLPVQVSLSATLSSR
jgi:hypothetical protein